MKKLKLNFWHFWIGALLILIVLSLVSCTGYTTPAIGVSANPFIVDYKEECQLSIDYDTNPCYYYSKKGQVDLLVNGYSRILLPCNCYKVGDTIKIKDFITKQTDE